MQTIENKAETEYITLRGPQTTAFRMALMKDQSPDEKRMALSKNKKRALKLLILQKHKCIICGKKVKVEEASIHHFIPTSRGGSKRSIFNQTGAHQSCNSRKSNTAPTWIEWFRYIKSTQRKFKIGMDQIDLRTIYPEIMG